MSVFIAVALLICAAASVVSQTTPAADEYLSTLAAETTPAADEYPFSTDYDDYDYGVTFQESPVNLKVIPVSSNPDSCDLFVACSSHGSSVRVTFTCDNRQHCSQERGDNSITAVTSTGHLSVYVWKGSVICNRSNQVSWSFATEEIKPLCHELDSGFASSSASVYLVKIVLFTACLTIMVSAAVF